MAILARSEGNNSPSFNYVPVNANSESHIEA